MSNLFKKVSPKKHETDMYSGKLLRMATHQSTLHQVDIPILKGIHLIEQIWHSITATGQEYCQTEEQHPTLVAPIITRVRSFRQLESSV